jgi:hypothetical protein
MAKVKYLRQSRGLEFVNRSKQFLLFGILSHLSTRLMTAGRLGALVKIPLYPIHTIFG